MPRGRPKKQKNPDPNAPIMLGGTATRVLEVIVEASNDDEVVTSRTISERSGSPMNQTRTLLRGFRKDGLVEAESSSDLTDNAIRYRAAEGVAARLEEGKRIKADRKAKADASKAKPMLAADYRATALKVAAFDRMIDRWTGTAHREKKAITERGDDPANLDEWGTYELAVDGHVLELPACEIPKELRKLRKKLVTPEFRAAQRNADLEFLEVLTDPHAAAEAA